MFHPTLDWFVRHRFELAMSLNHLYTSVGISRQAVHQSRARLARERDTHSLLEALIRDVRHDHATLSCRAMYWLIQPHHLGRDRFEALCRQLGYMTHTRRNPARTTDSSGVVRFDNLTLDLALDGVDQLWSSDITYFRVGESFYYLTFVLDCFSRRILGHSVSARLSTDHTTLPALRRAVAARKGRCRGTILHSDGGGQYYADAFLKYTNSKGLVNSMCEQAWQNPYAERINGTIKNNYLRHYTIRDLQDLVNKVELAVRLYNFERPHKSLNWVSPVEYEKRVSGFKQP
jgi:putative transposase